MIPKFRAWDKENKKMYGCYGFDDLNERIYRCNLSDSEFKKDHLETVYAVVDDLNNFELMQSTGLKDKNGVEIFEGDCFIKIFRTIEIPTGKNGIEKSVGIVKFHEGAFQVRIGGWGYELLSEVAQPHIYGANDDYWENVVIGNIYENPELLEVEG